MASFRDWRLGGQQHGASSCPGSGRVSCGQRQAAELARFHGEVSGLRSPESIGLASSRIELASQRALELSEAEQSELPNHRRDLAAGHATIPCPRGNR